MDILLKFHFAGKYSISLNLSKNQKKPAYSRIEVTTENLSRDRKLICQPVPSHDITKFSLEEEIENLNKRSCDLKKEVATRMIKGTNERSCDKGNVERTKGSIQKKKSMSRYQLKTNDVATPLSVRDKDLSMKPQERSLQKKKVATSF